MENLSKTAPVEIKLNKSAAVDMDNSYIHLKQLLDQGYTTVKWNVATSESCPICKKLSELFKNGVDLARFLGYERVLIWKTSENGDTVPDLDENGNQRFELKQVKDIYRDAPMYNWAHVGCNCTVTVFNDKTGQSEVVTHQG
jgi:hypothetical protein